MKSTRTQPSRIVKDETNRLLDTEEMRAHGAEDNDIDQDVSEAELTQFILPGDLGGPEKAVRPAWDKNMYMTLWTRNYNSQSRKRLVCDLCQTEIKTNPANSHAGIEVYNVGKNYTNKTKPHIDHYSPDWVDRFRTVQSIINHASPPFAKDQATKLINWAMNAAELRIVHKECNLMKKKSTSVGDHAGFKQKANQSGIY